MFIFISLYLLPPLHLFLHVTATEDYLLPYRPTDPILLNCGASSNLSSPDGRSWDVAPPPAEQNPSLQERRAGKRSSILHVIGIVGGSIGAVIACSLIVYFLAFKQKRVKDTSKSDQEKSSWTLLSKTSSVDGINMEEQSSLSPHRGVMASDEDDMFSGAESCSRSTFSTDAASVTLSDPVQRARSEGVFSEIIEPKGR
ncbi:hypothetical protein DKX38_027139 [Salix brachista]|uniref:Malectin-like domain-containing protein n=1 Tax=Salix brachista TaxID=2182728 RepID=A0A5N5JBG2_9ROSI|nr:hypothetical protein DKX38_027139 [Salix brachista]